jgi:hypothetical protein
MEKLVAELRACLNELGPDSEHDATMVVLPAATAAPIPARTKPPRRRRSALPLTLAALVALAAAGVVALIYFGLTDVGGDNGKKAGGKTSGQGLRALPLRAAATWDPEGDGREHDEAIANATDGDRDTYWTTEGYNSGLGEKSGVGLVLDTGGRRRVAQVRVASDTPGFTAEIQTGDSARGPFTRASPGAVVGAERTFALQRRVAARYVVVWITELAHPDKFRAHLNEVTARGER